MKTRRGFTAIELVTVIGIIFALAAILFPVFARAREKAWQSNCESNLKQLSLAYLMYCADYENDGLDPAILKEKVLEQGVLPYIRDNQLFHCRSDFFRDPSAGESNLFGCKLSYGWNVTTLKEAKGRQPVNGAQIPLVFDAFETRVETPWKIDPDVPPEKVYPLALRHNVGLNCAFFDGHFRWLKQEWIEAGMIGDYLPKQEILWVGAYLETPKTAEKACFPIGASDTADGIYVFRVESGKAEQIAAGPLK